MTLGCGRLLTYVCRRCLYTTCDVVIPADKLCYKCRKPQPTDHTDWNEVADDLVRGKR